MASADSASLIRSGLIARLHGLKSRLDLNWQKVLILRLSDRNFRWGVFVVGTADQIAVQPKNIDVSDAYDPLNDWLLYSVRVESLGDFHMCHEFTAALEKSLSESHVNLQPRRPADNFVKFAKEKLLKHPSEGGLDAGRYVIIVAMNAAAHEFAVDVVKVVKDVSFPNDVGHAVSVRARIFQSWFRSGSFGYTAKEFAEGAKGRDSFGWMESNLEVMDFFKDIQKARDLLDGLIESDLLLAATAVVGTDDAHVIRAWAAGITDNIANVPLQMQPGSPEHVDGYVELLKSRNITEMHAAIFLGELSKDPQQILDFPIDCLQNMWRISQKHFYECWTAGTFLKALNFLEIPEAYTLSMWKLKE